MDTSGVGYMSQQERCFALAVFLQLNNISLSSAYRYCSGIVRGYLKKAMKELESSDLLDKLRDANNTLV